MLTKVSQNSITKPTFEFETDYLEFCECWKSTNFEAYGIQCVTFFHSEIAVEYLGSNFRSIIMSKVLVLSATEHKLFNGGLGEHVQK